MGIALGRAGRWGAIGLAGVLAVGGWSLAQATLGSSNADIPTPAPDYSCQLSVAVQWFQSGSSPSASGWAKLQAAPSDGNVRIAEPASTGDTQLTLAGIDNSAVVLVPGQTIDFEMHTYIVSSYDAATGVLAFAAGESVPQVRGNNVTYPVGTRVTVNSTNGTNGTVAYSANSTQATLTGQASGCTANAGSVDFYPTTAGLSGSQIDLGNSALGLYENAVPTTFDVTYPSDSDYVGTGSGTTSPTFSMGNGTYSLADSNALTWTNGFLTGTLGAHYVSVDLVPTGAVVCTQGQETLIGEDEATTADCDGGSSSSTTPAAALSELNADEDSQSTDGSDSTPLAVLVQLDYSGSFTS